MRSTRTIQAAIAVTGVGASVLVASAYDAPTKDAVALVLMALGASGAVGVAGAIVLRTVRGRSLHLQVTLVALVALVAVVAGAAVAAQAMFISTHDLGALLVVICSAAGIAAVAAVGLAGRIAADTRAVGSVARTLVDGSPAAEAARAPASAELAALADELAEIRESLAASRLREQALDQSRRELVAWVSHDLRTPLAGLRAMAEALSDGVVHEPDDVAHYLQAIRGEVDRLSALVTDLFELSRIQSGTLRLQPARVSVADLVSDVLAGATPMAAARGVRIHGEVDDGQGPEAEVSVPEFQRALHNLIDNAIRHTPPDGAVRLRVGVDGDHAVVSVHDECGGIPDPDLQRVFEVAFSGDPARSPEALGGAGLGLSITRGIIEAHAGEVDVRNEAGGCRFTIRLPLAPSVP